MSALFEPKTWCTRLHAVVPKPLKSLMHAVSARGCTRFGQVIEIIDARGAHAVLAPLPPYYPPSACTPRLRRARSHCPKFGDAAKTERTARRWLQ